MKKVAKKVFYKLLPYLSLVALTLFQGMTIGYTNVVLFSLIYSLAYYCLIFYPHQSTLITLFVCGIILDSTNDILFGITPFMFCLIYLAIQYERKFIKVNDFTSTYMFYAINIIASVLLIRILSLFITTNFVSPIEFILIALLFYPILYNIIKLCINILYKNH